MRERPQGVALVQRIESLGLKAEQYSAIYEACSALVAVNVYRELQRAKAVAEAAESGCAIIGNCSCSK